MDQVSEKPIALYLEDLHVGQRFTSDSYHMDENRIKAFAAEFDLQPFHLDEAVAQTSVFSGLSASGWHTAAVAMRLLVTGGLPLGKWHYRLGWRAGMAKANAAGGYATGRKRGSGDTAVAFETEPGCRQSTKQYIESTRGASVRVYSEAPRVQASRLRKPMVRRRKPPSATSSSPYFRVQHARRFSRNAEIPSCASAASAFMLITSLAYA
jgi:hypothetical protein